MNPQKTNGKETRVSRRGGRRGRGARGAHRNDPVGRRYRRYEDDDPGYYASYARPTNRSIPNRFIRQMGMIFISSIELKDLIPIIFFNTNHLKALFLILFIIDPKLIESFARAT